MIRVGLVGFGLAGRVFHGPLISSVEGLELAAVVERHGDQAAVRYPSSRTVRSLDELLADESIGLVVVATPSGTHFDVARQVLAADKAVIVDKPMAARSSEIAELMKLAQTRKLPLIPFHNRRWDGDFLTLKQILEEGRLGRLVALESRFDRWNPGATRRPWKEDPAQGGGVLLDLGTHLVDQAVALFGKPIAVAADVTRERDGEGANDAFTLRLRYNRFVITLGANALTAPPAWRYVARGTRGNFRKQGVDPQEAALNKITRIDDPHWGEETAAAWGTLQVDVDGGMVTRPVASLPGDYRRYYAGVRDAVLGKAPAPVLPIEAWRVARILEWAQETSDRRREMDCAWHEEPAEA